MNQVWTKYKMCIRFNGRNTAYWLFLFLMTLPHLKVDYLNNFPFIETVFDVMRGATFLVTLLWFTITRRRIPNVIIWTAIWRVVIILSTILHDGQVYVSIARAFSMLSVMLLYELAYTHKDQTTFLSAQLFCFELVVYINFLTEVFFPNGMYVNDTFPYAPNWFLGYYNSYSVWFVPGLMFAWLYGERTGKKMRTLLFTAGVVASIIKVYAGGEALSVACMVLVFIFFKNKTGLFNYINYWLLHIYFILLVFIFRIQNLFFWLLDDILGKMGSFLGRLDTWEKTLVLLKQSPIIGFGLKDKAVRMEEYHSNWMIHSHNQLMELLYQGGIVGLVLFGFVVFLSGRQLMKYAYTKESKIISIAFLGWCIATLVEPFTTPFLMGMFVVAYRSNQGKVLAQDSVVAEPYRERLRRKYRVRMQRR